MRVRLGAPPIGSRNRKRSPHDDRSDCGLPPKESPADIGDRLDAEAELIPRMLLVLRKLARIPKPLAIRCRPLDAGKVGRKDPALG
jgi:hypothetical protein